MFELETRSIRRLQATLVALICMVSTPSPGHEHEEGGARPALPPERELAKLDPRSAQLTRLRREISANLQSAAKTGDLEHPLRFVRYRVRRGDDFFSVMGLVSQNMDTLASVNDIINPNALRVGTVLRIPNARGLVAHGGRGKLARHFQLPESRLIALRHGWFVPGHRFTKEERDYFLGNGFLPPLRGRLTSGFGLRRDPFTQQAVFHGGVDIGAAHGTLVHASREGRVVFSGWSGGYGRLVILEHRYGYRTYYGHLSSVAVGRGARVRAGQQIGRVGSTGRSTGPHLHFEVRKNGIRHAPKFVHGMQALR